MLTYLLTDNQEFRITIFTPSHIEFVKAKLSRRGWSPARPRSLPLLPSPTAPGVPPRGKSIRGNEAVAEPLTRPPTPRPWSCTARCRELGSSGESSGSRERSGKREASRTSTQVLTAQLTRRRGFPQRPPPRPSQNPAVGSGRAECTLLRSAALTSSPAKPSAPRLTTLAVAVRLLNRNKTREETLNSSL